MVEIKKQAALVEHWKEKSEACLLLLPSPPLPSLSPPPQIQEATNNCPRCCCGREWTKSRGPVITSAKSGYNLLCRTLTKLCKAIILQLKNKKRKRLNQYKNKEVYLAHDWAATWWREEEGHRSSEEYPSGHLTLGITFKRRWDLS